MASEDSRAQAATGSVEVRAGQRVPPGWSNVTLGDVVELKRGYDLPAARRRPGDVPIVSSSGVSGWHVEGKVDGPGVVTGRYGTIGQTFYLTTAFWPLNTSLYVRDFRGNDPRFVAYQLRTLDFDAVSAQSSVPGVNRNHLHAARVIVPPVSQQQAIGEVLGALDDKIATVRRLVSSADTLITATVRPHLVIRRPLWEAVRFVFGEAYKGGLFTPKGTGRPLIRIRDLKSQQCHVWTNENRPRERLVNPGEVLVGMDAEFRATRWSGQAGLLNQRVLLAHSEQFGDALVREIVRAPLSRAERSKSGTTVIHLNKRDLRDEFAVIPNPTRIPELRAFVDPLWARCVAAERESQALAATRDELLPLLMSGRITVKDAERRVEDEV